MNSIADFGPLYAETLPGRFPVEPWNTYSNLVFFAVIIYFIANGALRRARHPLLFVCLPILLVGFMGGTIFHATRSHSVWLILDFIPIIILAAITSLYFWWKITGKKSVALLCMLLSIAIPRVLLLVLELPRQFRISLGYTTLAFAIVLPLLLHARRNNWRDIRTLCSAIVLFSIAIIFRMLDKDAKLFLPMGSHFLWHLFGGAATFCVMLYVYRNDQRVERASSNESSNE
jgi:predicted membrane channel-forming protein YqfA (hemolysin III family)